MSKVEDLPKIESEMKKEIEKNPPGLCHVETKEKCILPDKETIEQEKQLNALKSGIESFAQDQLKSVIPNEKNTLPDKEAIEKEKEHNALKTGIESFAQDQLKNVTPNEKNSLPTKEDIEAEKKQNK